MEAIMRSPHPANLATLTKWIGNGKNARGKFYAGLQRLDLGSQIASRVLIGLLNCCLPGGGGGIFESASSLAKRLGVGVRSVKSAIKFWRLAGVLRVLPKRESVENGWPHNEYALLTSPFEAVFPAYSWKYHRETGVAATPDGGVGGGVAATPGVVSPRHQIEIQTGVAAAHKGLTTPNGVVLKRREGRNLRSGGGEEPRIETDDDGASDEGRGDADEDAEYDEALRHEILICALEEHRKQDHSADLGI
jgi:hypothetical protein